MITPQRLTLSKLTPEQIELISSSYPDIPDPAYVVDCGNFGTFVGSANLCRKAYQSIPNKYPQLICGRMQEKFDISDLKALQPIEKLVSTLKIINYVNSAQNAQEELEKEVEEKRLEEAGNFEKKVIIVFGIALVGLCIGFLTKPPTTNGFSESSICKAAISMLFGRPFYSISSAKMPQKDYYLISYTRAADQSYWDYHCKLEGKKVIWRAPNGRWRDHPLDGVVTYKTDSSSIIITETHADGSQGSKRFQIR